MGQVSVAIGGRTYRIACDDGEENHVAALGEFLDRRTSDLARVVGPVGEALLLALTALVVTDELWECRHALDKAERARDQFARELMETRQEMEEIRQMTGRGGKEGAFARAMAEEEMALRIEHLAEQIETLAERLE